MHRAIAEQDLLGELGWVRRLARALARDEAGADDLVQDTWLAARDAGQRVPADGAARRRWLGGIVKNLARRRYRSDLRRAAREAAVARHEADGGAQITAQRASQSVAHANTSMGSDDVLTRGALHRDVTAAVMALAEPYRSAVLLRYLDGLTGPEVAARLGISHAAARQRIARGLAALRADLDARHGGERALWVAALPPAWLVPSAPIAAPVPTLTTLAILIMQSKLSVSFLVLAAVLATLALRARDGDAPDPTTGSASPSVAAIEAPATSEREARSVGTAPSIERVAAGPATGATLAFVDDDGAARSDCVVLLRERDGWRELGDTDADGHLALGELPVDLPASCELAIARRDQRVTRLGVDRASLTDTSTVTGRVAPRGSLALAPHSSCIVRLAGDLPRRVTRGHPELESDDHVQNCLLGSPMYPCSQVTRSRPPTAESDKTPRDDATPVTSTAHEPPATRERSVRSSISRRGVASTVLRRPGQERHAHPGQHAHLGQSREPLLEIAQGLQTCQQSAIRAQH